jgi:ankyrin repeat protein
MKSLEIDQPLEEKLTLKDVKNVILNEFKSESFDIAKIEAIIDQYKAQSGDLNQRPMFGITIVQEVIYLYNHFNTRIRLQDHDLRENKILAIVELLVNKGASHTATFNPQETPMLLAGRNKLKNVEFYLNSVKDVKFPTEIDIKQQELLDLLKSYGIKFVVNDLSCYMRLVSQKEVIEKLDLVKTLVEKYEANTAPYSDIVSALNAAVIYGQPEVVKYLLNKKSSDIIKEEFPLHLLATSSMPKMHEILEDLIKNLSVLDININQVDSEKNTALYLAVSRGNYETAKILLQYGADINLKSGILGETPLQSVAMLGNLKTNDFIHTKSCLEITKYLISFGANVEGLDVSLITNSSILRAVNIGKVIQGLCKLQGDKNTIELGEINDEERIFAKEIIINYLIKNGMPNTFCEHLEKFVPIELIKNASDDISISYDIRELLKECSLQIEVLECCLRELNKNTGAKFGATTTSDQSQALGTYLLSMIKLKGDMNSVKNVSMLTKFMLYQFMNNNEALNYQVEELTKCVFPADKQEIKQLLIKELKALEAHKLWLTPEDHKEAALFFATKDESLVTDETEGKPIKVLGNEEYAIETPNSVEILEKALSGDLDHAD